MAFADLGMMGTAGSTGNNQGTLVCTTATAGAAVGNLVIVAICDDNISTGGGDTLEVASVADSGGNIWAKAIQNSTNLASQAGSSVSIWWSVFRTATTTSSTITATFTNAGTSDATAMSVRKFSVAADKFVQLAATAATTSTTTNPGSLNPTTSNREHLRVRAIGCEYDSTQTFTVTGGGWAAWTEAASAATGTITEQCLEVEWLISTATGGASAPTLGSACDAASVYAAFIEVTPAPPIIDPPKIKAPPSARRLGLAFAALSADAGPIYIPPPVTAAAPTPATVRTGLIERLERVLYDQTSTPVFSTPAVTASMPGASAAPQTVVRLERVVYDPSSRPVLPPTEVATGTPSIPAASAYRELTSITRRVIYDPSSRPVALPAPAVVAQTLVDLVSAVVRRLVVGSLTAFATASALAEPVFVPPQATTAAIAPSELGARARRPRLPDGYAAPVTVPSDVVATPSAFAYQPVDAVWRVQKKVLPDGFTAQFRILAVTPSDQFVDATWRPRQQRKVLPESYAERIYRFPTTPYIGVVHAFDTSIVRRAANKLPEGITQPPFQPAAAPTTPSIPAAEAFRASISIVRRVVYDPFARPVYRAPYVPPVEYIGVVHAFDTNLWRRPKIKPVQQSAFVFLLPEEITPTPAAFGYAPAAQNERTRSRVKPVQQSAFCFLFAEEEEQEFYLAGVTSTPVVVISRVVYDQTAVRPLFPPAPSPTTPSIPAAEAFRSATSVLRRIVYSPTATPVRVPEVVVEQEFYLAGVTSTPIVVTSRVVYDQTAARPLNPPVFVPTPGRFVPDAPQGNLRRQRIKPIPQSAMVLAIRRAQEFYLAGVTSSPTVILARVVYDQGARSVFPPVAVDTLPPTLYQAEEGAPRRRISRPGIKLDLEGFERPTTQQQRLFWFETYAAGRTRPISLAAVKSNLDGIERPTIQVTITPSYLFETIQPGWKARPNAVAIKLDLDGFERPPKLPPPPTSTPTTLYDNIGPVKRTLPNRVAIKIDLDGFTWTPQKPGDLTGVIPIPPQIGQYPTGGESWWHQTHKKPAKSDQRCRFVTIDGVLTWICDRASWEMPAEARLQALDILYDAEGVDLEPLYEQLRLEEATNASAAKRLAAVLLMHAIHEAIIEEEDDDLLLLD